MEARQFSRAITRPRAAGPSTTRRSTRASRTIPTCQGVASTFEKASPLYRWTARFGLRTLERILARAGLWDLTRGRLREVYTAQSSAGNHYLDVVLRGSNGVLIRTAEELREVVRDLAPLLYPKRYPGRAPTSSGRLPETLPSNRYEARTSGRTVHIRGRGWGHGVGMSQWGAFGLADRGAGYDEILRYYYRGTAIAPVAGPGQIDVGLGWGFDKVEASGAFRIIDGRGRTLVRHALGDWSFRSSGSGAAAVNPPKGFGLPLRVVVVDAPDVIAPGESAAITIALTRPARVGLARQEQSLRSAGRSLLTWQAPPRPGVYRLKVRADSGNARRSAPFTIEVRAEPQAAEAPSAPAPKAFPILPWAGVATLVAAAALALLTGRMKPWGRR